MTLVRNLHLLAALGLTVVLAAQAPKPDQSFYKDVVPSARERQELADRDKVLMDKLGTPGEPGPARVLTMDFSAIDRPRSPGEFRSSWHFPPKRQWWTGTCWCFSTTSLLESEARRIHGREIKLSEMFTVYWDYVEKVREFVRTKGSSLVDEGAESGDVLRCWKQYGIVREADYPGLPDGEAVPNHQPMLQELRSYLEHVKKSRTWDEGQVVASVRLILDKHLGTPPQRVLVGGRELTPQQFLASEVKLDPGAYVALMSTQSAPFWAWEEYKVPDNWAHTRDYLNVPLADWYGALQRAIANGFTVAIGGDVSEPGYEGSENIAIVPTFDLPADYIDQSSRELRIVNHTTEDDHGLHVVGQLRKGGQDWFLVKDSARSSHRGAVPGYYFYRGDYVRLKVLTFLVHKDAIKDLVAKAPKAQ